MLKLHRVVIVALPPTQLLELTGLLEALTAANQAAENAGIAFQYEILLAAPSVGAVSTTSGVSINATLNIFQRDFAADTLIVAGGPGAMMAVSHPHLIEAVAGHCERTPRVGSIGAGAFVLAATGFLENRSATTHWAYFDEFQNAFPRVRLERNALYLVDGKYSTSAGNCAAIDYAFAIIQHDLGKSVSLHVAQDLLIYLVRPAGQSQFSPHLAADFNSKTSSRFGDLTRWLDANLADELSVEAMAEKMAMSPRNFARRFKEIMHVTPNAYLQDLRVQAAQRLLSGSNHSIPRIAKQCGFASATALRSEFKAHMHMTPEEFRSIFRHAPGRYCFS